MDSWDCTALVWVCMGRRGVGGVVLNRYHPAVVRALDSLELVRYFVLSITGGGFAFCGRKKRWRGRNAGAGGVGWDGMGWDGMI